jgi:aminoglycoside/choline kinase family phosphotransferase
MITADRNPGIIDFQMRWPDHRLRLVSLLKDCYIGWPRARVERWVEGYRATAAGGRAIGGRGQFLRWFDLVGLQRHIKVFGICATLVSRRQDRLSG